MEQPKRLGELLFAKTPEVIPESEWVLLVQAIAGGDQRIGVALERDALFARHLEKLKQFADGGGVMHPLAHQGENRITRKHLKSG